MVVLAIVVILTSLLMPGLRSVRETANRLTCGNNLRHIGLAMTSYADDNNEYLPSSVFSKFEVKQPSELMAVTTGGESANFEGIGRLLPRAGRYLDAPTCLFCASHTGEHSFERYEAALNLPAGNERAYANYHFRGDVDMNTGARYRMTNDHDFVLVTDGLRTQSDFNHRQGLNVLFGDLAVLFHSDVDEKLRKSLPTDGDPLPSFDFYNTLWKNVADTTN